MGEEKTYPILVRGANYSFDDVVYWMRQTSEQIAQEIADSMACESVDGVCQRCLAVSIARGNE